MINEGEEKGDNILFIWCENKLNFSSSVRQQIQTLKLKKKKKKICGLTSNKRKEKQIKRITQSNVICSVDDDGIMKWKKFSLFIFNQQHKTR
jgi:hypothetical protein